MEIGIYIDDKWEAAILTITNSALIIKCLSKSIFITYKDIVYNEIEDDNFIHISYVERTNGDARKKNICINSNNNDNLNILEELKEKKEKEDSLSNQIYTPPETNVYANESYLKNTVLNGQYIAVNTNYNNTQENVSQQEISKENIQKQNEMNKDSKKPIKKVSLITILIASIIIILASFYIIKTNRLNVVANLITGRGEVWSLTQATEVIGYQFNEGGKCKYIHKTIKGNIEKDCVYETNNHKLTITLESNQQQIYTWNIKYRFKFTENGLLEKVLYLEGDNKQIFENVTYDLNNK